MIVSAEFKNFRALRDLKIDLEPFTVIVGPNSCGKSTILEGLKWLVGSNDLNVSDLKKHISQGTKDDILVAGKLKDANNNIIEYQILSYSAINDSGKVEHNTEVEWTDPADQFIGEVIMLNPNAKAMARASYGASLNPIIDSDGRGLATVCANFHLEYPEYFEKIQEQMRRVIPSLKRFRIKRAETTNYIGGQEPIGSAVFGDELVFDFDNAPNIPANFVSEGTLITLCILIVAVRTNQEPFLLLIDDLERGLHPMATRELIQVLRDLQKENPNLQIVATTHSPDLVDQFEPKEVRVAALDPVRGTVVARLDESPDFEKWYAVLETGEVWSHMGENWVLTQKRTDALLEEST